MENPELKRKPSLVLEVAGLLEWLVSEAFIDSTRDCQRLVGDSDFRIRDHPTRTQRESNRSRHIGEMLATITNPFGSSA